MLASLQQAADFGITNPPAPPDPLMEIAHLAARVDNSLGWFGVALGVVAIIQIGLLLYLWHVDRRLSERERFWR